MIKTINIILQPSISEDDREIRMCISKELKIDRERVCGYKILKRSIDARPRLPKIQLSLNVFIDEPVFEAAKFIPALKNVTNAAAVIIVGAGPAGLFAALKLIALGIKPIVVERGKNVRERRRDIAVLNKYGVVNPESNYCFGEGGAGAYSDGKLYTRSSKRGSIDDILNLFVYFGADASILYDAHPHIGTNKLPDIIASIRNAIIECGGEVRFEQKLTDFVIEGDTISGIKVQSGEIIKSNYVILATGHSANDIFYLLEKKVVKIECKPFAIGVRIEHPQELIDKIQYHCETRDKFLPPASYSLVTQVEDRGVFSFCMCPGGIIAPASTEQGEVVVNGWSPSKRDNPYANSGTVVSVDEKDFLKHHHKGPLAGLNYRQMIEQKAFITGGGNLKAPAQRLVDFTEGKFSNSLPKCSYHPGTTSALISEVLPQEIYVALKKGIIDFGRKMKGYLTEEAIMVAAESRTSSPVRIPRDSETLQHVQIKGLYPCGEGAGYAGGIVSAAIDGERCALAIAKAMNLTGR